MKKQYEEPQVEIIKLLNEDIVTGSKQFGLSKNGDNPLDWDTFWKID